MKKILCVILSIVMILLAVFSSSAFTLQSSGIYKSADASGAYVIRFNGRHADIERYAARAYTVGLNPSYNVSAVCACNGKVVLFCDDSDNNQLIVYVYDSDTDFLDSFAIYGAKLYNTTDFCCDDNAVYIENHRDKHELKAYSYGGALVGSYRFEDEITAVFHGYRSGVYAVGGDVLYTLSGNVFTAVSGTSVEPPLFPADQNILVSVYGAVSICNGGRITDTFTVDDDYHAASACVIGDRLYYPCGSMIYGYDINTGEKVSYYKITFAAELLYADGNMITVIGGSSYTTVSQSSFTEIKQPDNDGDIGIIDPPADDNNNSENTVKMISSDTYRVDFERCYITGISPGTTVAEFKRNMNYDGYTLAIYRDGSLRKSGNVGTAMTAVFTADNSSITFELSVSGDITGEGNSNSRDIKLLMDYLIGTANFNGVYEVSADVSDDGAVDVVDLAVLKSII